MSELENETIHLTITDDIIVPEPTESPETVEMSVIEETAKQQGWSPDKGDLNALEFLGKGREFRDNLYNEVKGLRTENQKVYGLIADNITQQNKTTYDNDIDAWEAKIDAATEDGNVDEARQLRRNPPATPAPQEVVVDPKMTFIEDWTKDNTWFETDPELRKVALGFYQAEKIDNNNVDDPTAILPKVRAQMEKLFEAKINPKAAENTNKDRESGSEKGGKSKRSKGGGLTRGDLTEEEGRHIDQLVASGLDEKKLMKSIEENRR
jgi:hypothetical protein